MRVERRFFLASGVTVSPEGLINPKGKHLGHCLAAGEIPHATLVECKRLDSAETVVFDVRIEVPNRRVHKILRSERIATTFYDGDDSPPKVEALRSDFPIVSHLNLHVQEYPRCLCVDEERYEELKRRWTAPRFVQRIREWLELTSRGELHQEDQRLEPLLVNYSGHIVLMPDLITNTSEELYLTGVAPGGSRRPFLLTQRKPPADGIEPLKIVVNIQKGEPRTHGVIYRCPATLADVAAIARAAGLDLIADLRRALPDWKEKSLDSLVILVLVFPKMRTDGGPVENHDVWCFVVPQSVREVGQGLGVWEEMNGDLATLLPANNEKRGQDIPVDVLNPCFALTRDLAARLNGRANASDARVAGVGVGALGSQIVMNLARSGFGRWTLIDADRLMPHNVARHALDGRFVGMNKAEAVAYSAGTATFEDSGFQGLDADLLGWKSEEAEEALSSADVIIDMTASVAAQRHLARETDSQARRICVFLNPSGTDLVVLAEDEHRRFTLDVLEMQYYRALLHDGELAGHIDAQTTSQRYARSCGDTTSVIPQDFVALHAAIASKTLKEILDERESFISVWRADVLCGVRCVPIEVRNVTEFELGQWTVVLDDGLLERLSRNREDKLPNETGGILLGSFDLERDILYIVDTLPSPPDSEEKTDLYIRGCKGLGAAVSSVDARTGGMLEYVGEWHSHPDGVSTKPSGHDLAAFDWLTALMSKDGLPAIMMIAGQSGEARLFINAMDQDGYPIP